MRVEQVIHPIFESCRLPAVFIDEYLPLLSGDAVRLYLLLLRAAARGETPERQGLAGRLRLADRELVSLFDELVEHGLLQLEGEGICSLTDLQNKALERSYRPRTSSPPSEQARGQAVDPDREALVTSISNTYFNGMLSANWYNLINELLTDFGFDLPVVYSLFSICAGRNKLNQSYVRSVAADWQRKRVVTQEDLDCLNREWEQSQELAYRVGRLMNRRMTRPDQEEVNSWVARYGYGLDMIEAAISRTKGIESPNLNYVAKVLESWHEAGLKSPVEIASYEEKRRRKAAGRPAATSRGRQRDDNVGNFEERHYSEDYLDSLGVGRDNWQALDRMLELNRATKGRPEVGGRQKADPGQLDGAAEGENKA